jgi:hypothetical protein
LSARCPFVPVIQAPPPRRSRSRCDDDPSGMALDATTSWRTDQPLRTKPQGGDGDPCLRRFTGWNSASVLEAALATSPSNSHELPSPRPGWAALICPPDERLRLACWQPMPATQCHGDRRTARAPTTFSCERRQSTGSHQDHGKSNGAARMNPQARLPTGQREAHSLAVSLNASAPFVPPFSNCS